MCRNRQMTWITGLSFNSFYIHSRSIWFGIRIDELSVTNWVRRPTLHQRLYCTIYCLLVVFYPLYVFLYTKTRIQNHFAFWVVRIALLIHQSWESGHQTMLLPDHFAPNQFELSTLYVCWSYAESIRSYSRSLWQRGQLFLCLYQFLLAPSTKLFRTCLKNWWQWLLQPKQIRTRNQALKLRQPLHLYPLEQG